MDGWIDKMDTVWCRGRMVKALARKQKVSQLKPLPVQKAMHTPRQLKDCLGERNYDIKLTEWIEIPLAHLTRH